MSGAGKSSLVEQTLYPALAKRKNKKLNSLTQAEVIGAVNRAARPQDVVVCAAGSLPGDLHKLWRTRDPKGYHLEYGYSCMGYEIAGGLGVKMAAPDREVYVMVGDGSYLMMPGELVTAVQEGVRLIVVLVISQHLVDQTSQNLRAISQQFQLNLQYAHRNRPVRLKAGKLHRVLFGGQYNLVRSIQLLETFFDIPQVIDRINMVIGKMKHMIAAATVL